MIVISLPLMIVCLVANLVFRLPDVYEYSLTSSNILQNTSLSTTKEEVQKAFSDFMQGKTDELKLIEKTEYKPEDIFSKEDKEAMKSLRTFLNVLLVIGLFSLFITFVVYFFMIRWRVKGIFMDRYKQSLWVFIGVEILNVTIKFVDPLWKHIYGLFMRTSFKEGDNMVLLLGDAFPKQVALFELIVGSVVMALVGYLTWSVAGRKKLFKERWSE